MRSKQVLAYNTKVIKNYDRNLLAVKSEPITVIFWFSIVVNVCTISQKLLESHDVTIPSRSNGNQSLACWNLKPGFHGL